RLTSRSTRRGWPRTWSGEVGAQLERGAREPEGRQPLGGHAGVAERELDREPVHERGCPARARGAVAGVEVAGAYAVLDRRAQDAAPAPVELLARRPGRLVAQRTHPDLQAPRPVAHRRGGCPRR